MTGPTYHATVAQDEQVATNTTWTKCRNPHIVPGLVNVAGDGTKPPVLTIEPGVIVRFERNPPKNAVIRVGDLAPGRLVVNGTAADPVTMQSDASDAAAGDYIGINWAELSDASQLKYLTTRHCGAPSTHGPSVNGCILAQGDDTPPSNTTLFEHVTIDGSETQGIVLASGAASAAGSGALTVRNGGSYAVAIQPEQAGSLPGGGTYTGNSPNAILLLPPAFVRFTSDAETPAPGDWRVMDFANEATPNASRLDRVIVEYAGGFNGYSPGDPGNITVRTPSQGGFITDSTIRFSAGCGIVVLRYVNEEPIFTTDFTALGNTFANNAGAAQCGPYAGSRR